MFLGMPSQKRSCLLKNSERNLQSDIFWGVGGFFDIMQVIKIVHRMDAEDGIGVVVQA
jgi:UDP-N-acetyl-D-mannosaminuronic acid transferase (WecB/TagA/CpsF family)